MLYQIINLVRIQEPSQIEQDSQSMRSQDMLCNFNCLEYRID